MLKEIQIIRVASQIHLYGGDAIQYVKDHPNSTPDLVKEANSLLLPLERKIPASIYIGVEVEKLLVKFMDWLNQDDITQIEIGGFKRVTHKFMTTVDLGWNKDYIKSITEG